MLQFAPIGVQVISAYVFIGVLPFYRIVDCSYVMSKYSLLTSRCVSSVSYHFIINAQVKSHVSYLVCVDLQFSFKPCSLIFDSFVLTWLCFPRPKQHIPYPPALGRPSTVLGAWLIARRMQVAGHLFCLAGFGLVFALCALVVLGFFPLSFGFHIVEKPQKRVSEI